MIKGNNSSKKGALSANNHLQEQYRSQSSKASSTNKNKQKFSVQNMKQFKYQIDHEIAKCLDTLDRQGLKFLKETLRASKLFGLNTQELGNTQLVEEEIEQQYDHNDDKEKSPPKKKEIQKNIQIKKVPKPQPQKKPAFSQKPQRIADNKSDLGEKIHKKLESMNIKTGKKSDPKQQVISKVQMDRNKKPVIISTNQIQQEIIVQEHHDQEIQINAQIKNEEHLKNSSQYSSEKTKQTDKANQQKFNEEIKVKKHYQTEAVERHNEAPIKPFYKKPFKNFQGQDHKQHNKDYGIQISKEEQIIESNLPLQQQSLQNQKINYQNFKQFKEENQSKREQKKQECSQQVNVQQITKNQQNSEQRIDPSILNLITKINKLSPNKRLKLQKLLQKLEDPYIQTSMLSVASSSIKQQPIHLKPYISPKQSFLKQSNNTMQKSKSRTKLQKMQKATSIKKSLVKKIQTEETPISGEKKELGNSLNESNRPEGIIQFNLYSKQGEEKQQQKEIMFENIEKKEKNNQNVSLKQSISLKPKQQIYSSLTSSHQQSGQKLIKIGKKKTSSTNITIKILSNNGHTSLVGLGSILIYSQFGEIILIDETNIKQYSPKLLKLFTEFSEGWTSQLSTATISIQNILQPIGGVRILNFNKSQLESNKQADLAEIFVNDQLHWRGQLKGGSYKEDQNYVTDIKISSKQFVFPNSNNKSLTTSKFFQQKPMKRSVVDPKIVRTSKEQLGEAVWLEKDTISKKMKQIQQQQKNESSIKKIQSVRGTMTVLPKQNKNIIQFTSEERVDSSKLNNIIPQNIEKSNKLKFKESDDILGQLSKSISTKKKQPIVIKEEPANIKKKQEYLLLKEKQQDDEFQKILKSFEKRQVDNPQQKAEKPIKQYSKPIPKKEQSSESKGKLAAEKCFEDFMKDSLFDDLPKQKKIDIVSNNQKIKQLPPQQHLNQKKVLKKNNDKDLDNLIDELNDVVGTGSPLETGQQFTIPELPQGKELTIAFLSNWGNQGYTGLNGIQIFNVNGDLQRPCQIISSSLSSRQLIDKLFKSQLLTTDERMQLKLPKIKKNILLFNFGRTVEIAAMRIWNYNGHRVHSNIGVRKCHIKFDSNYIFSGEIQQSTGSSEDAYKYCEYILFTQNGNILKKIKDKDWVSRIRKTNQDQRILFKTTLQNFHRPPTRNDEESVKKDIKTVQVQREPIKLPKRLCFEYQPPQLPEGFVLKFILHSSWGDRFFIGLNGIEIFNEKGQSVTNHNISQIRAQPSSISKLQGYQGDKRVVTNLINNRNNTVSDSDIWLAPLLSDVQKIQKGRSNIITIEYSKSIKISGINFYNYTKTPERGVRELQIYLDRWLLYRGYLRKYNVQDRVLQTTINFTKDQTLLQAMNYIGYNEDHLEQDVGLINEQKVIRQSSFAHFSNQKQLIRPMTGKLLM